MTPRKPTGPRSWVWRRHHPRVLPLLALTLVWCLFWGEVTPGNLLAGGLLATLVLGLFPFPRVILGLRPHLGWIIVLAARFLFDVVLASLEVAYKVTVPWSQPNGRITQVQLTSTHDITRTMTAQFTTLVPGSLVLDVDRATGIMTLHLFDAATKEDELRGVERAQAQEQRILRALRPVAGATRVGKHTHEEVLP